MKIAEKKLAGLYERLRRLGPMLPGTLESRDNICGKAGCRCKDKENPVRHGPYHRLCVGKKGMTGTFFVRGEDAEAVGRMCAALHEAKELLSDIALTTMVLWREGGAGKVEDAMRGLPEADAPAQPPHSIQSKLEASRDKWKSRAKERHTELEKGRIKLRDLAGSREKWRGEALAARKAVAEAEGRIAKLEKDLLDAKKNFRHRPPRPHHQKNHPATPTR